MKTKTLVLLALLCGSWMSHAQDTVPPRYQSIFGDSVTRWYIFQESFTPNAQGGTETREAIINDTAIIDGHIYQIVRYNYYRSIEDFYILDDYKLYFRETPDHSKLYFKPIEAWGNSTDYHEVLIMDLDLNVGDTVDTRHWSELPNFRYEPFVPNIRVDSIYYLDGRKIVRTNLTNLSPDGAKDTLLFIEGAGPSFGLYYPAAKWAEDHTHTTLVCYERDEIIQYHGTYYYYYYDIYYAHSTDCLRGWSRGGIKVPREFAINAYPNPVHDAFEIALPAAATYNVAITTLTGCVLQTETVTGDKLHVDIQQYPKGVYLLSVVDQNNNKSTIKIVKL